MSKDVKITEFGKFLRKLRVDVNQKQKDMAAAMGVPPVSLSRAERGMRIIPGEWVDLLCELYDLGDAERKNLIVAVRLSQPVVTLHVQGLKQDRRLLASLLADRLEDLTDAQCQDLLQVLAKSDSVKVLGTQRS